MPNKSKMSILLLSLISATVLLSCENSEPVECILPETTAAGTSPVIQGGSIRLTTPSRGEFVKYEWTGPNNFTSNEQNPILTNVTTAMVGDYKVRIVDGLCKSPESIVNIEIMNSPVTCNQPNNTATFEGFSTYNYYVYRSTVREYFEIRASGSGSDMTFTFGSDQTPLAGVYTICNECSDWELGNNKVKIDTVALGGYYFAAAAGEVVVTFVNGKISAAFCNVLFNGAGSSYRPVVSAKVTE